MGFLLLPLIIGVIACPMPGPPADRLANFARLQSAAHEDVYVVDTSGQERRLTLLEAGDDAVTFVLGQQRVEMNRAAIVSVERTRDSNLDGVVKGALIGVIFGAVVENGMSGSKGRYMLQGVLTYSALGYLFDRGHAARQLLYRAPAP